VPTLGTLGAGSLHAQSGSLQTGAAWPSRRSAEESADTRGTPGAAALMGVRAAPAESPSTLARTP
jgi:hypothetical protein